MQQSVVDNPPTRVPKGCRQVSGFEADLQALLNGTPADGNDASQDNSYQWTFWMETEANSDNASNRRRALTGDSGTLSEWAQI